MRSGILGTLIYCTQAFIRKGIHELADTCGGINDDVWSMDIETSPRYRLTRVIIQAEGRVILLEPEEYSFPLTHACIDLQGYIYSSADNKFDSDDQCIHWHWSEEKTEKSLSFIHSCRRICTDRISSAAESRCICPGA